MFFIDVNEDELADEILLLLNEVLGKSMVWDCNPSLWAKDEVVEFMALVFSGFLDLKG